MTLVRPNPPRPNRENPDRENPNGENLDGTPENDSHIEAMLRLYEHLRNEILVSIRFQNRVILGEAVVVGLIYGIRLTWSDSGTNSGAKMFLELAAMMLPPVIIISTALWTVEQTRMMRIGNYLELLENRINEELDTTCVTWENWLRSGNVSHVGTVHHIAKVMGYIGFFLVLGSLGLYLYIDQVLITQWSKLVPTLGRIDWLSFEGILLFIYIFFFGAILLITFPIVTYRQSFIADVIDWIPSGQQWTFDPDENADDSDDARTANEGHTEDTTVADGGPGRDQGANENGEDTLEWARRYSNFNKWECCYQVQVLDVDPEEAIDDTGVSELPNVEITEERGLTSVVAYLFTRVRGFIRGE